METIRFGDGRLQVKLRPLPPDKQAARKARVAPWPQGGAHDSSVPNVKQKIKDKLKDYGPTDDPLTLAGGGKRPKWHTVFNRLDNGTLASKRLRET